MSVVDLCLFKKSRNQFEAVEKEAIFFCDKYMKDDVPRDSFINFLLNYAREKKAILHYFSLPMNDENLFAFTFPKKGRIFTCINNQIPLCKQNFALAHEAYHIYCYLEENENAKLITSTIDRRVYDNDADDEELKANAFAGMVMIPKKKLEAQINLFNMDEDEFYSPEEICTLMDFFGMPFKSIVLRLFECNKINEKQANDLLEREPLVEEYIKLTGISQKWQNSTENLKRFSDLQTKFKTIQEHDWFTEEREKEERKFIENIVKTGSK